jgi:hypothetical protein
VVVPVVSPAGSQPLDWRGRHSQGFIDLKPDTLSHFETSYYDDNFVPDDVMLSASHPDSNGNGSDEEIDVATYAMHVSTQGDMHTFARGAGGAAHTRPMGQLPPLSGASGGHARHTSLSAAPSPLCSPTDARYWRAGSPDANFPQTRPKSGRQVWS